MIIPKLPLICFITLIRVICEIRGFFSCDSGLDEKRLQARLQIAVPFLGAPWL